MAALIKKNELEKYLRTHKCNKTYIVHIKETLRKKHIYQQTLLHNPIKDLNCMRLLLSLENCRDTKIISCLIV